MRFFIDISYNGASYHGWQIQPNAATVQCQINNALSVILNTEIKVVGAGRTDTGVHAKQLIAHFDFDQKIDVKEITFKMNGFLADDIAINDIYQVIPDAHARFSAISRIYEYRISKFKDPFTPHALLLHRSLDISRMNSACKFIIGENDYSSFAKLHSDNHTNNCKIFSANWSEDDYTLIFSIKANRFLRNMVRSIVGTMIDVGDGKTPPESIKEIILAKDRAVAGYSVPANGLSLLQIEYSKEIIYAGK